VAVVCDSVGSAVSRNPVNLVVRPALAHVGSVDLDNGSVDLVRTESSSQSRSINDVQEVANRVEVLDRARRFGKLLSLFVNEPIPQILRERIRQSWSIRNELLEGQHELADEFHWVSLVHLMRVSVG
jgi:hypothetical protein